VLIEKLDIFFNNDHFSQLVTYTTESGAAQIKAIIDYGANLEDRPKKTRARMEIAIKAEDVPDPKYKDTIEIGTATWMVERLVESDGVVHVVEARRDVRSGLR